MMDLVLRYGAAKAENVGRALKATSRQSNFAVANY